MPIFAQGERAKRLVTAGAEAFTELMWPTRCVLCDMPGELLCEDCRAALPWIEQRLACPYCGAPFGHLTCTECEKDWETRACVAAMGFHGAAARMVSCLKDAHELRLAPVIAQALLVALEEAAAWPAADGTLRFDAASLDAVCFVPATAEAYRRRGFDHMELVSQNLASELGFPLYDVLARAASKDQRELSRTQREENLAGTMHVVQDVSGLELLLVDDVVTTGSSMREAARTLFAAGAASVTGCALARVW